MGRRMIVFCRLLLLLLTIIDLGTWQTAAGTLPSSPLRRHKKSIMDLQLSPASSEEEEEDELEEDDNESDLAEANNRENGDEDEDADSEGGLNGWSTDALPIHSSFRERQVAAGLLHPITATISKRSTGRRKKMTSFFSEREREGREKRQKKQYVVVHPKTPYSNIGPDPSRAHQMFRNLNRRNPVVAQQSNRWNPAAYQILPDLEVSDDENAVIVPLMEKKSSVSPDYNNYYEDSEDYGLENSKEDEAEAIDAALKYLSWQRLTKRLIQLEGLHGPYFDRGERSRLYRRTLKKRSSSLARGYQRLDRQNEAKKELEAILSDDNTAVKLKRSYSEATKKISPKVDENNSGNNKSKVGANESLTSTAASKEKSNIKLQPGKQEVKDKTKISKGKQWVPYDSERTLRSKKSWDQYFGVDKRSIITDGRRRRFSHQKTIHDALYNSMEDRNDENDEDDTVESEEEEDDDRANNKELQNDLIKWYFDKVVLKSNIPNAKTVKLEVSEEKEDDDDNEETDNKEERKKKSTSSEVSDNIEGIEAWTKKVDERLRRMENSLLTDTTKLLEKEVRNSKKEGVKDTDVDEIEKDVINHLKVTFSLEKMRDALEDLQETVSELGETVEESNEDEANSSEEEKQKKKNESQEASESDEDDKKKKKSVKKKRVIEPSELTVAFRPQITSGPPDLSSEVASPVFLSAPAGSNFFSPCPLMINTLDYCEELSEPLGEMGKILSRSCIQHMLCYTCEKSPGSCNRAFLQEVESLCEDDFRCQAIAGAMRSVFLSNHDEFRRRNKDFCEVDQCLQRLLQTEKK